MPDLANTRWDFGGATFTITGPSTMGADYWARTWSWGTEDAIFYMDLRYCTRLDTEPNAG